MPPEIQRLLDTLSRLPGVIDCRADHTPLEDITVDHLGIVDLGDLPHSCLRRTKGGLNGEALGQIFFTLDPSLPSWRTLEYISWFIRDCSRGGDKVQIRSLGLPPKISGSTQLGSTLQFVIDFFVDGLDVDPTLLLTIIVDFAKGLEESIDLDCLDWSEAEVIERA